jgi:hypothetical protein
MVLTCAVLSTAMPLNATVIRGPILTRRGALAVLGAGAAALAVAGCSDTAQPGKTVDAAVAGDPLGPLYTETIALITTYDQTLTATPALASLIGPLRDEHRQHAVALASLMGAVAPVIAPGLDPSGTPMPPLSPASSGSPGSSATPGSTDSPASPAPPSLGPDAATARTVLSAAEKTAQTNAVAACLAAPATRTAVLASIAACRATHVAALA